MSQLRKVEKRGKVFQGALVASLVVSVAALSPLVLNHSEPSIGTLQAAHVADGMVQGNQLVSADLEQVAMQGLKLSTQLQAHPVQN